MATRGQTRKAEKTYTITLTDEQIKTIRSLYLRMEMLWLLRRGTARLNEDGTVEHVMIYECLFCNKGSYEGPESIEHTSKCTYAQCQREWTSLNAQFIRLEQGKSNGSPVI